METSQLELRGQDEPSTPRSDGVNFRRAVRFAALLGVAGSATFLLGVLGAQTAQAASDVGTTASSSSSSATSNASAANSLLGKVGHTVKNLIEPVQSVTKQTPAVVSSVTEVVAPTKVVTTALKTPLVQQTLSALSKPTTVIAPITPVTTVVNQLIEPPLAPALKPLEPITSSVKNTVQGLSAPLVFSVHQLVNEVLPPLSKLPVAGAALPPVSGVINGVIDDLLPTVNTALPVTGVVLPDSTKPVDATPPAVTPPGVLPGMGPGSTDNSAGLPGNLSTTKVADNKATAALGATTVAAPAKSAVENSATLSSIWFAGLPYGAQQNAPPAEPIAPAGQANPSHPVPTAPGQTCPIPINLNGSSGTSNSLAATVSNSFLASLHELSEPATLVSSFSPESLSDDPGSSPD